MVQLTILCLCLPTLLLAAPVEDAIKQQIAMRQDEMPYWNYPVMQVRSGSGGRPGGIRRELDSLAGNSFGVQKKNKFDTLGGRYFGGQKKRNFDEIDNAGFGAFVKKRNFDEIDNLGVNFGFKKRNFDEIDNAGFDAFIKRSN